MKNNAMKFISTARQIDINIELFRIKFTSLQKKIFKTKHEFIDTYRKTGIELNSTEYLSKIFAEYDSLVQEFVDMDARIRNKNFKGIIPPKKQLECNFGGKYIGPSLGNEESEVFDSSQRKIAHKSGMVQ